MREPLYAGARSSPPEPSSPVAHPVFDLAGERILRATADLPLVIPENAVVVPGARAVARGKGREWGLSLYAPVIVKYRDEKTDLSTTLEELLR